MADVDEGTNSDYIVMTPTKKGEATHIKIERRRRLAFDDSDVAHVAGGQHKGLVINKQTADEENDLGKPQLQLSFTCFLIDQKTGEHIVEMRKLKFWYVEGTEYLDQVTRAYDFFKELIKPDDLPRDYVGFIKKCMKQMQGSQYKQIKKVDLSMQQLNKDNAPLSPEYIIEPTLEEKLEATINVEEAVSKNEEEEITPAVIIEEELEDKVEPAIILEREEKITPAVIIVEEETISAVEMENEEKITPVIIEKDKNITTFDNYVEEERIASVQMEREELIAPVVVMAKETVKPVDNIVEEEKVATIQMEREERIAPVVFVEKEKTIQTIDTYEEKKETEISPVVTLEREQIIAPAVVIEEKKEIEVTPVIDKDQTVTTVDFMEEKREEMIAPVVIQEREENVAPVVVIEQEKKVPPIDYMEDRKKELIAPFLIRERKEEVAPVVVIDKEQKATTVDYMEDQREDMIAPIVIHEKQEKITPVVVVEKEKTVRAVDIFEDHREEIITPVVIHEREERVSPLVAVEKEKAIDRFEERREEMVAPIVVRVREQMISHLLFPEKEETLKTVDNVVEEEKITSTYMEKEEKITPVVVVEKETTVKSLDDYEEEEKLESISSFEEDALLPVDDFEEIVMPPLDHFGLTADGLQKVDNRPPEEIINEKLLHILESAYPNILAVEDLIRITAADEVMVREQLKELHARNLVTEMEQGGFMRHVLDEKSEVQLVKQMPTIATNQQPTIAIITAMYYEKLAVDAMMENKTTYMKYKTEGESNVYTIGFIGEHKVVSTKLPAIGHAMFAQISSGNTTTRLLGTFQNIEYVFIVGVAGGVPYYTDYYKHVRLGDIVISKGGRNNNIYYYCQKILKNKEGDLQYVHKTFASKDTTLQQVAQQIAETAELNPDSAPWEQYIEEGQALLQGQEADFVRPLPSTDRLYMNIGDDNIIEVEHPQPPQSDGDIKVHVEKPRIHFGVLGSGRPVVKTDATRLDFASKYNIKAFDTEFDQVLESIEGNRKDCFMFIRGISDYTDGSKNKEWQPYAALAAASYMKTIIKALSNPLVDDM